MNLHIASFLIPFTAHPLLYLAFAFALGISIQYAWVFPSTAIISSLIISLGVMLWISFHKKNIWYCALVAMVIAGAVRYDYQRESHRLFQTMIGNNPFDVTAVVTGITRMEHSRMKYCTILETQTVTTNNDQPVTHMTEKHLQIFTFAKPNILVQDTIAIKNLALTKSANESYNNYLIKENVAATLFLPKIDSILINRPTQSLARWLYYFKENLLSRCKSKLKAQTFAFFSSVFLGNRFWGKKHMETPKESCKTWGISHYLARSGLHMVIFIFAWHLLLNILPLSLIYKESLLVFLSIIYYLLSWPSISFIRAFLSFMLFKTCNILKLPSQLLHLLTIVALLVLAFNPMQLFFLDFQLSFGLTFALAWFNHLHNKKTQK